MHADPHDWARDPPRVLFLSPQLEDYLADGVMHGLRLLLGDRLVDYPRHDLLYDTVPAQTLRSAVRSRGFTLYGRLPEIPVDRARVIEQARWGEFDAVVFSTIHFGFGAWVELFSEIPRTRTALVVLDGSDGPAPYPYAGRFWRDPRYWTLPRAHTRAHYLKRELTPQTYAHRFGRLIPAALASRLPVLRSVRPTAFSIPESNLVDRPAPKDRRFATHIVDPEVAARVPGSVTGAPPGAGGPFGHDDEPAYYADLRRSRFGITTKRGGWDCLRHYEIAASATVPCFRALDSKPATCAPHGLDRSNCVVYRDADDLFAQIDELSEAEYARRQSAALAWARRNTTTRRAAEVLDTALPQWFSRDAGAPATQAPAAGAAAALAQIAPQHARGGP